MSKTLCDLNHKALIKADLPQYRALVIPGKYVCQNCGRVAAQKKLLCNPYRLEPKNKKKK